ncbi:MAG TPA: c-type cytochrome [Candidatus Polarisedimenticolaceae bacterium]|nr:c-type cytochrome [Candidatus Polarisedimenticolaceae bacterium]
MRPRKLLIPLAFLPLLVLTVRAASEAPAPKKAEEQFKNIQVLKGVPADDIFPTMQFISASLNVECDFCHVDHQNEKDDKKEKQIARKMIAMTLAIDRENFEGKHEVTCFSCHRGAEHPLATPLVASTDLPPESEKPPAGEPPAADAVLAKYLAASGGPEAIAKVTSRVMTGKLAAFGEPPVPIEVYAKAPGQRISIVKRERGESKTAFDGEHGWLGSTGRPARDMNGPENDAARIDARFALPVELKGLFAEFRSRPGEKIDGKDTVRVVARKEGAPPTDFWFDAESGLLVRQRRYVETALGRNPTEITYADYRDADGIKLPFRWIVARPSGRFTVQVDEMKQNVPVDDALFQKPVPPAEPN